MINEENSSPEKYIISIANNWLMIILIVCLISILILFMPGELTLKTLVSIGYQFTVLGMISMGLLIVFYSGQFDFSLGGVFTVCLFCFSYLLQTTDTFVALVLIMILGAVLGSITGYLSILFKNSLLVTFVMLFTLNGVIYFLTAGQPSTHSVDNEGFLYQLAWGVYMQVPISAIVFVFIALCMHFFFRRTLWGHGLMVVGIDSTRASHAGLNVKRIRLVAFVFAAVMTSLASVIYFSRVSTISPAAGNSIAFNALSVIVISTGGLQFNRPSPLRLVLVAYLLILLDLCFGMLGISIEAIYFVTGCLIILSLFFGHYINK